MTATVVVEDVTITRITVRGARGSSWAILSWDERGKVSLSTDHGAWVSHWPAERARMPAFLSTLDTDYLAGNFLRGSLRVHDNEGTLKAIRDWICHARYDGNMTRDEARAEWEIAAMVEEQGTPEGWMARTKLDEPWHLLRTRVDPAWTNMWERLWLPHIRPALQLLAQGAVFVSVAPLVRASGGKRLRDTPDRETHPTDAVFLRLWTEAHGTDAYDKASWKLVQRAINAQCYGVREGS